MKKSHIILVMVIGLPVVIAVSAYFVSQKESPQINIGNTNTQNTEEKPIQNSDTLPEVSEIHPSDETGWSAFKKTTSDPEPNPDVTVEIGVGRSASEPKTISAKAGQRVKITFTSAINDQVVIENYTVNTYIMPLGEFSMAFNADKKGKFAINLVDTKRTVGYLEVN